MSNLQLTKTGLKQGIWEGVLTGAPTSETPVLKAHHAGQPLDDIVLSPRAEDNSWVVRLTIPPEAISDGLQTILITEAVSDAALAQVHLMAGDDLGDDLRA